MKDKNSEIAAFALYARQVSEYKKDTGAYQQKVEYIKSLFEVREYLLLYVSSECGLLYSS